MAIISQEQAAEENRKRLEEEAQKNSSASLINNFKDDVQLKSFPQVSPEERTRVMNEQAAKISGLRDSLPSPIQMNQAGAITPVSAPIDPFVSTTKAEQYLSGLSIPTVPIGNGAFANQSTADNMAAFKQTQREGDLKAKNDYGTALAKIYENAPARQAAAKAANMTDEAGQKAGIARYDNFRQGIADREQDERDVQQEMRLSKDQLAMAKANIQNIKRAQLRGEVVNPAHIAAAHDYLSRADRRTGGAVHIDEQKRRAGSNVKLYRDDSIAFNKKYGISNEDYSRPKNDMAPVAAPAPAPAAASIKKPEERGRYSRSSPFDSMIGYV